jgi:surfactin synthase thioesterase subunit
MSQRWAGDLWIVRRQLEHPPRLRLFCAPYAGGGAAAYREWLKAFSADVDVCALQLPGRERRHREPALTDMGSLVEALVDVLEPYLDCPFAFFGHSMGSVIAYETARAIRAQRGLSPRCLFVSGRRAPHLQARKAPIHPLPDKAFLDEIRALNGTPPEVLAHAELMALMLPLLRADFTLVETYRPFALPKLECPIVALAATEDPEATVEELAAWRDATLGNFALETFRGDHFYLNANLTAVIALIMQHLSNAAN